MSIGPQDSSKIPRFAGIATFALLPRADQVPHADVKVVGVPFDSGVSYRPGARFGPAHVRESSRLLRPYNPVQDVSPFETQQVADAGAERPSNGARHFVMLRDGAVTAGYLDSPTAAQRTFKRGVKGLIRAIDVDHMPEDVDEA